MKEINPNGIYNREELADLLGVTPRTVTSYYKVGLPRRPGMRGNRTTGRQLLDWLENGRTQTPEQSQANPKLIKFRRANGL